MEVGNRGQVLGFWEMDREDLLLNPLSGAWSMERLRESPIDALTTMAICYPLGMIGYTLSLVPRVTLFVVNFFNIFRHLFMELAYRLCGCQCGSEGNFKEHLLVFLGSTGELVSGVIGIVCPPIAYQIDSFIQQNQTIYNWYSNHFMSLRAGELIDDEPGEHQYYASWQHGPHEPPRYAPVLNPFAQPNTVGNEERIENKTKAIRPHFPFYENAKSQLQKYLEDDQFESFMDNIFQGVLKAALLEMLKQGSSFLDANIYGRKVADLKKIWKEVPAEDREDVAKGVLYKIVFTTPEEDELDQIKEQEFLFEEQTRLERYEATIEQIHQTLVSVAGDFGSTDRESYSVYVGHTFNAGT